MATMLAVLSPRWHPAASGSQRHGSAATGAGAGAGALRPMLLSHSLLLAASGAAAVCVARSCSCLRLGGACQGSSPASRARLVLRHATAGSGAILAVGVCRAVLSDGWLCAGLELLRGGCCGAACCCCHLTPPPLPMSLSTHTCQEQAVVRCAAREHAAPAVGTRTPAPLALAAAGYRALWVCASWPLLS